MNRNTFAEKGWIEVNYSITSLDHNLTVENKVSDEIVLQVYKRVQMPLDNWMIMDNYYQVVNEFV